MDTKHDNVNSPVHYVIAPGLEVIDVREALLEKLDFHYSDVPGLKPKSFQIDCWSRAWEYLTRIFFKNGLEDAKKAMYYLDTLINSMESKDIHSQDNNTDTLNKKPRTAEIAESVLYWHELCQGQGADIHKVRVLIKCTLEECCELIESLHLEEEIERPIFKGITQVQEILDTYEFKNQDHIVEAIDAAADITVTALGTLLFLTGSIESSLAALHKVNNSNYSKFDKAGNPIKNEWAK
jgi:hypothetical protein